MFHRLGALSVTKLTASSTEKPRARTQLILIARTIVGQSITVLVTQAEEVVFKADEIQILVKNLPEHEPSIKQCSNEVQKWKNIKINTN